MGDSGTGKTRMAFHYMRALYKAGFHCGYVTHADFAVSVIKANTSCETRGLHAEKLKRWRFIRVLLLDDIGGGANSERATQELQSLLETRTKGSRPTIWTSECTDEGLVLYFGERGVAITRRLCEFGDLYMEEEK